MQEVIERETEIDLIEHEFNMRGFVATKADKPRDFIVFLLEARDRIVERARIEAIRVLLKMIIDSCKITGQDSLPVKDFEDISDDRIKEFLKNNLK
jgi:hypothetical protein